MAQEPTDYYKKAEGKSGEALKTALFDIIKGHTKRSYKSLWTDFGKTNVKSNGKVWVMYTNCDFTFGTDQQGGTAPSGVCDKYNREHSFPKSYWGGSTSHTAYTDLFHVIPCDATWNTKRSNNPYGIVVNTTDISDNGSKNGYPTRNSISGYNGKVFEPADQYKGDLARNYFYMATRYQNEIGGWQNKTAESNAVLDGSSYKVFEPWLLNILLQWHKNDPVDQRERDRNEEIYKVQRNRNPYIDHPEWVDYAWNGTGTVPITISMVFASTSSSINETFEGNVTQEITVNINSTAANPIAVTVAVDPSSDLANTKYSINPTRLTFNGSETSKKITVTVKGDNVAASNKKLVLKLQDPSKASIKIAESTSKHTINVIDAGVFTMEFAKASSIVNEPVEGTTTHDIAVNISDGSFSPLEVTVEVDPNSTLKAEDYILVANKLSFAGSETSMPVQVTIKGEKVTEDDATLILKLINPSKSIVSLKNNIHTITIRDAGDGSVPLPPTALSQEHANKTVVYPNPSSGDAIIEMPDADTYHVDVLNTSGVVVQTIEDVRSSAQITDLQAGFYIIYIHNDDYQIAKKLIVR